MLMNANATSATVKGPLPISPLTRVVSGNPLDDLRSDEDPSPLGKGLHGGLLVVLWFLPGSALLGMISFQVGPEWRLLLFGWGAWLVAYAVLASILTVLVRLGASSVPWTLVIHALACAVVQVLSASNELLRLAFPWTLILSR